MIKRPGVSGEVRIRYLDRRTGFPVFEDCRGNTITDAGLTGMTKLLCGAAGANAHMSTQNAALRIVGTGNTTDKTIRVPLTTHDAIRSSSEPIITWRWHDTSTDEYTPTTIEFHTAGAAWMRQASTWPKKEPTYTLEVTWTLELSVENGGNIQKASLIRLLAPLVTTAGISLGQSSATKYVLSGQQGTPLSTEDLTGRTGDVLVNYDPAAIGHRNNEFDITIAHQDQTSSAVQVERIYICHGLTDINDFTIDNLWSEEVSVTITSSGKFDRKIRAAFENA